MVLDLTESVGRPTSNLAVARYPRQVFRTGFRNDRPPGDLANRRPTPVITPQDIALSRQEAIDWEVAGVINGGGIRRGGKTILVARVVKRLKQTRPGYIRVPVFDSRTGTFLAFSMEDESLDITDPRDIKYHGVIHPTTKSSLHLAISNDAKGERFKINSSAVPIEQLVPDLRLAEDGIEDCRVTDFGNFVILSMVCVSRRYGVCVCLARTTNWKTFEPLGKVGTADMKGFPLVPELIDGMFIGYPRPLPGMFGKPYIETATSRNLTHWGDYRILLEADDCGYDRWDSALVGPTGPPIRLEDGNFLFLYHGAKRGMTEGVPHYIYCTGSAILSSDGRKVLARSYYPIHVPWQDGVIQDGGNHEVAGFYPRVVYAMAAFTRPGGTETVRDQILDVYYGAADESIGLASFSQNAIVSMTWRYSSLRDQARAQIRYLHHS